MSSVALALAGLGRSLLEWHARRELFADPAAKRTARAGIARALDHVLSHHSRPSLQLRALAASMPIGEAYLCDALKSISGRGFLDHLQTIRVLHVAVLLAETDLTIQAASSRCGYLHPPQLNRHFRRLLHTTPGRFRRLVNASRSHL